MCNGENVLPLGILSMPCYSYFFTKDSNRAVVAFGGDRDADILTEGNEEIVDGEPIFFRKYFTKCKFGLVRILCFHISPAIGNPVNVGIHTDAGFLVSQSYYQICRLAAYAIEF